MGVVYKTVSGICCDDCGFQFENYDLLRRYEKWITIINIWFEEDYELQNAIKLSELENWHINNGIFLCPKCNKNKL